MPYPARGLFDHLDVRAAAFSVVRSPYVQLGLILVLVFAVYFSTLSMWFMGDDFIFLRGAQTASSPWAYVRDSFDFRNPGPPADFSFYRPLYQASFLGFYKLFGLEAWAYHC